MPRTFFQDFTRDNGDPITVEYEVDGSYILSAWPNTEAYNELHRRKREIEDRGLGKGIRYFLVAEGPDEELREIEEEIAAADKACQLTEAERERMEAWIAEHYVEEYDDEPSF